MECKNCGKPQKRDDKFCFSCGTEVDRGRQSANKRKLVDADILLPGVKRKAPRDITEPEEIEVDEPDPEPEPKYPWGDEIDDDDNMDDRIEKLNTTIKLQQEKLETLESEMTWLRNNMLNWAVAYKDQMKKK